MRVLQDWREEVGEHKTPRPRTPKGAPSPVTLDKKTPRHVTRQTQLFLPYYNHRVATALIDIRFLHEHSPNNLLDAKTFLRGLMPMYGTTSFDHPDRPT